MKQTFSQGSTFYTMSLGKAILKEDIFEGSIYFCLKFSDKYTILNVIYCFKRNIQFYGLKLLMESGETACYRWWFYICKLFIKLFLDKVYFRKFEL